MQVLNQVTSQAETRTFTDVWYVEGSRVNLISLNYMQTKLGYKLVTEDDQTNWHLVKEGTHLS